MNWIGRHLSRMAGAHSLIKLNQILALAKLLIMNIFVIEFEKCPFKNKLN